MKLRGRAEASDQTRGCTHMLATGENLTFDLARAIVNLDVKAPVQSGPLVMKIDQPSSPSGANLELRRRSVVEDEIVS